MKNKLKQLQENIKLAEIQQQKLFKKSQDALSVFKELDEQYSKSIENLFNAEQEMQKFLMRREK